MSLFPKVAFGVDIDKIILALRCCSNAGCKNNNGICPYSGNNKCGKLESTAAALIEEMAAATNTKLFMNETNMIHDLRLCGTGLCIDNCHGYKIYSDRYCDYVQRDAADTITRLYKLLENKWGRQLFTYQDFTYQNAIFELVDEKEKFMNLGELMITGLKKNYAKDYLAVKSIEQSADHETLVVLWKDGSKTFVKRSSKDPDDIYMAFTAACAKKIFGTNSHIKKYIATHLNEHKPRMKKETKTEVNEVKEDL